MDIKRVILTTLTFICSLVAFSQKMSVEKMEALSMDTYASVHKRVDNNGIPCAAVKVSLPLAGATFSGTNHIGSIDRIGADYIIFMPAGSKKMYIQHPNFHELEVVFGDYGIDRLQSVVTYRVTVNVPQMGTSPQKMQTLNIKVTPSDAIVQIDGEIVDGNTMSLAVGTHRYNVAARGYNTQEGTIDVNEKYPAKLLIELDRKSSSQSNTQVAAVDTQIQSQSQPPILQPTVVNTFTPQTFTVKGVSFTMLPVEGGTFTMGGTSEQGSDAYSDEKPTHSVTLSSYYIGKYEVTQELWQAVMGSNPSYFKGTKKPVENVSWDDCQTFISKLNSLTGRRFRLPTEAEWEYAARGGKKSIDYKYSGSNNLNDVAWYYDNSGSATHDVGQKSPNELGIYDMSGNAEEWCQDWYGSYSSNSQTNPIGTSSVSDRVYRGGSWGNSARYCRSSYRDYDSPDYYNDYIGLRLALSEL